MKIKCCYVCCRDELKDTLKPELQRLEGSFTSKYGTPDSFQQACKEVQLNCNEIKANLVRLNNVASQLAKDPQWDIVFGEIKGAIGKIANEITDAIEAIQEFDLSTKITAIAEGVGLAITIVDAGFTIAAILAGTLSAVAAVAAAAFAVIGIALAAVTIAISAIEERKLRDKLRTSVADHKKAIRDYKEAHEAMEKVQEKFYNSIPRPLRKLATDLYQLTNNTVFKNLQSILNVNSKTDITITWIDRLNVRLIEVNEYIPQYIDELRTLFKDQQRMISFVANMKMQVYQGIYPPKLFNTLQTLEKPTRLKNEFNTLTDVLVFIAEEFLKNVPCYWGYDLSRLKLNPTFKSERICDSPQLTDIKSKIEQGVSESKPPCTISLHKDYKELFDDKYKLVKYIADYVRPQTACYWGYNLEKLRRKTISVGDINKGIIDRGLYTLSLEFTDLTLVDDARLDMCDFNGVCNSDWQNYFLCISNEQYSQRIGLDCSALGPFANCKTEIQTRGGVYCG